MLLVQSFINIGMNMGISPVTGIPLPLVSGGGSSLWSVMIALGMAQSVYIRNR
jgi:rod shape determining protein RodA